MIEFHDPRGHTAIAEDPYELTFDLASANQATIGLLANGFPDSENFLRHIGNVLEARIPGLAVKVWNKGNASIPAPPEMLADIQAHCQAAVAAYGH
jgi:hypothetical protein